MNKYKISINPAGYKKIQKKLQKYNIKIGGLSIRKFLIANSTIEDLDDSLILRTKRVILHIGGELDKKPEYLNNEVRLQPDLLFGHYEFMMLRRRMELLCREYDKKSKITANEVQNCRTVGDCIDLVNSKIPGIDQD